MRAALFSHSHLTVPGCATCNSRLTHHRCLQEITYLTSPGALNPLPAGPPISVERSVSPASSDFPAGSEASAPLERPRKVLAENPPPSLFVREPGTSPLSEVKPEIPNGASKDETPASLPDGAQEAAPSEAASLGAAVPPPQGPSIPLLPKAQADAKGLTVDSASQPPSSPLPRPMPLPEEPTGEDPGKQILTAIYRPDSKAAWREELRAANEQAEKVGVQDLHEALFVTFGRRKNRVSTDLPGQGGTIHQDGRAERRGTARFADVQCRGRRRQTGRLDRTGVDLAQELEKSPRHRAGRGVWAWAGHRVRFGWGRLFCQSVVC